MQSLSLKSRQVKKEKALEKYTKVLNTELMDLVDAFDYEDKRDHVGALIFSETLSAARHSKYLADRLMKDIMTQLRDDEIVTDTLSMMDIKVMQGITFPSNFIHILRNADKSECDKVLETKVMIDVFEYTERQLMCLGDDDDETFLHIVRTFIIPSFREKNGDSSILFSPNLYFLLAVKLLLMLSKDELLNILGERITTEFYLGRFDGNGKALFRQYRSYTKFTKFESSTIGQMLRQEMALWQLNNLDTLENLIY